jgi:hypothetical protein
MSSNIPSTTLDDVSVIANIPSYATNPDSYR